MTARSPVKTSTIFYKEWMTATIWDRNRYPTSKDRWLQL